MKKREEMNGTERIAYRNIKGVYNWEVGGWFNCIEDDMPEYIPDSMADAKEQIYEQALNDRAGGGMYVGGGAPKEMRFAGAGFIRSVIDHLFATDEDIAYIASAKNW